MAITKERLEEKTEALHLDHALEIVSLFEFKQRRDSCGLCFSEKEETGLKKKTKTMFIKTV